jgi:GNAT superfamily N-acetyltransferase
MQFTEREMTDAEFTRMQAGFDEHTLEQHNPLEISERFGFVVTDSNGNFIGCSSGLAYQQMPSGVYSNYFYLSDLFVEKPYRGQGIGVRLLRALEERITPLGITHIWTWTAGYEAPSFYKKQGYEVFTEMENWYASGHSRVGLKKSLIKLTE